jgi:hypothetical protein
VGFGVRDYIYFDVSINVVYHNIRTPALRSPARAVRYISSLLKYSSYSVPFGGMGHVSMTYFLARRVRTDHRRVEDARVGGGQLKSSAREGRSLHVERPVDVEVTQGGAARYQQLGGMSRREERRGPRATLS